MRFTLALFFDEWYNIRVPGLLSIVQRNLNLCNPKTLN